MDNDRVALVQQQPGALLPCPNGRGVWVVPHRRVDSPEEAEELAEQLLAWAEAARLAAV
ncbi:hypothetical protein [Spongiactinospora rosea]|uniref:hypothetical protein n=1 Tax=Spongiactinospora rosea TaxID=2248750 RepID=UPI0013145B12|nr:hypothetical protein [Spongiactinospora rosea]